MGNALRRWLGVAVVLGIGLASGNAHAYRLLTVDESGNVSCGLLPECDGGTGCPVGLSCEVGPAPLSAMACFPPGEPGDFVYCCSATVGDDCPVDAALGERAGRCETVTTSGGTTLGICVYDGPRDFCTGDDGTLAPTTARFEACITEVPMMIPRVVRYARGNCDGNLDAPNGSDPCPCDPTNACTEPDAGTPEQDAGTPGNDAGTPEQDAGSKDAGAPGMDGGTRPPRVDPTVRFHGAGGCDCSVGARSEPGSGSVAPAALAALGILALLSVSWRRRRSRAGWPGRRRAPLRPRGWSRSSGAWWDRRRRASG